MAYFKYNSKKVFYKEIGSGEPLLMLHGDTASSKMFEMLSPLYCDKFKVILIDFIGSGKSDRVDELPSDLWIYQSEQVIALIEYLQINNVNIVGTSGGAWVAINVALKRPDLVKKVIADSFDGRTLNEKFSENLIKEREYAKSDSFSVEFYKWCNGDDWERVVDINTEALLKCSKEKIELFSSPLNQLKVPTLLIGSFEDDMCRKNMYEEYKEMSKLIIDSKVYMFEHGKHPAMLSNAEDFYRVLSEFIES